MQTTRWFSTAKPASKIDLDYIRRYQLKHLPNPLEAAPKKITSYALFSKKQWETVAKGRSVKDVGKEISEKWKTIDLADKSQIEKEVEQLNAAATKGKNDITGKLTAGDYFLLNHRARLSRAVGKRPVLEKDPTLPTRPATAFTRFVKYSLNNESDLVSKYGSTYRDAKPIEKMKIVAQEYKSASPDQLKKLNEEYEKEKQEYKALFAQYAHANDAAINHVQNLIKETKKAAIAKYREKVRKETGEKKVKKTKKPATKAKKPAAKATKIRPAKKR
ncbi:hypothetical protein HDV01_006887 [Terramyces sp. JEL0728]|nr:hypothetical protein HDV01_006887 [Terramyces sp. JEL0728]